MGDTAAPYRRYLLCLGAVFSAIWIALAIAPRSREDWLLENLLVVLFLLALMVSHRRFVAFAGLGATIAMSVTVIVNLYTQRDFSREWAESLRVKQVAPPD